MRDGCSAPGSAGGGIQCQNHEPIDPRKPRSRERPPLEDIVDLVTTGPEVGGVANRETAVVVSDLFRQAEHTVLVAGFSLLTSHGSGGVVISVLYTMISTV